jgi:hypothetical protein
MKDRKKSFIKYHPRVLSILLILSFVTGALFSNDAMSISFILLKGLAPVLTTVANFTKVQSQLQIFAAASFLVKIKNWFTN